MIFLIYTILVILQQYKGMATEVPDPCPSTIDKSIVADMCKSSFATEETIDGADIVDSVALRIMTQQDNCICRVIIENQIQSSAIGLRKYNGLIYSAPMQSNCGLVVDINHIPGMSTGNVIDPIECIENVDHRYLQLLQNSTLQFKSRIINGTFTRGYCMHIIRDRSSDSSQILRIICDAPTTTENTTYQRITSDPATKTSSNVEYSSIKTNTSLQTTDSLQSTTKRTNEDTIANDQIIENDKTTYFAVSAFSSAVTMILLVVLIVTCIRHKALQQNVNRTNEVERNRHYCDLTNNIPDVPGQEYDIIDSNYNTIDVDRSHPSNNVVCMEGEYISIEPDGHLTTTVN